jgi:hypothetical protein
MAFSSVDLYDHSWGAKQAEVAFYCIDGSCWEVFTWRAQLLQRLRASRESSEPVFLSDKKV